MTNLNQVKFWIPLALIICTLVFSLVYPEAFVLSTQAANQWILSHFSGLYAWAVLLAVILLVLIYASPFGSIRIGGEQATPMLSKSKWFSVTLCTTVATGILFWGVAEPIYHFRTPPEGLGIHAGSSEALIFSLSTMFMHWTLSPYAIYTLAALLFSYCFYNLKQPFAVGATLYPILPRKGRKTVGTWVDIICLYGLTAGMAASLGAGILTLSGGIGHLFGVSSGPVLVGAIALCVVVAFVISASSGLQKGIKLLSSINVKAFVVLALLLLFTFPSIQLIKQAFPAAMAYFTHFLGRSINWKNELGTEWFNSWTVFNWSNWLAWAPITALFLGRLGRGYTVRTFITMNLALPSLFGAGWMVIFSGSSLHLDSITKGKLHESLLSKGPESLIYILLDRAPWASGLIGFFLLTTFISYVTAADSNTSAMSALCAKGISPSDQEAPVWIKVVWGVVIGALAFTMINTSGISGIKMISVLGGFPALILFVAMLASMIKTLYSSVR